MLKETAPTSNSEATTFYCQVETYLGRKDYLRGGRCVRLIGVDYSDFVNLAQGDYRDGVSTFTIDLDLSNFLWKALTKIRRLKREAKMRALESIEEELNDASTWYQVDVRVAPKGLSYLYPTFSAAPPTFLEATRISLVAAPDLTIASVQPQKATGFCYVMTPSVSLTKASPEADTFKFTAFHVGQGMCSIVACMQHGVMFDAGAGKPITRGRYLAGLKRNDLKCITNPLIGIPFFILSHFDNDHWNLLAWDESLRGKIEKIFVPKVSKRSAKSVAFFDKEIIYKVEETISTTISLGKVGSVEIRRTQPTASDNNGHALVSIVDIGGRRALVPGDYVYSRMKTDLEPSISSWATGSYVAVLVPHHGDSASATDVPQGAKNGKAFFSAGTHDTWGHPKQVSIDKHKSKGYQVIHNRNEENIIHKTLI